MMRSVLLIISFSIISVSSISQNTGLHEIIESEKWLQESFMKFFHSDDVNFKDSLNREIISHFRKILLSEESFFYPFDMLNMIGKVRSEDNKIRVLTWHLQVNEKEYKYYGIVQVIDAKGDKEKLRIYVLDDKSEILKNPETLTLTPETWYGALYYGIHTFRYKKKTIYALFGYDFNGVFSDKKLIDVLNVERNGNLLFGGILQTEFQKLKRVIFEYSSQVVMNVRYDDRLSMIVVDHLSPVEPVFSNNYSFYSPDGSYDGFKFEKGIFKLVPDVDARNY